MPTSATRLIRLLFLTAVALIAEVPALHAAPRMISYGYKNCVACHVSPQGRGLLKPFGRTVDIDQSFSSHDFTAEAFGLLTHDEKYSEGDWNGRFGHVLTDAVFSGRINREFDTDKTDPAFAALLRGVVYFGHDDKFRLNGELAYRDTDTHDVRLGPNLTSLGGERLFLKKLLLEWHIKSGQELAIGRDYLPIGLQIDDHTAYILQLNRNGIYDYPLQLKYFAWTPKWLTSIAAYAPSFEEEEELREYGVSGLYEYYPSDTLALGVQGVLGFGEESDRLRLGPYLRWGPSKKIALLAELDYTRFWDVERSPDRDAGSQLTAFLQLHYHHTEWLVSSLTGNYACSDLLAAGEHHASGRYTLSARLNRNLTIGLTFAFGDSRRNLHNGQEGALFAAFKF